MTNEEIKKELSKIPEEDRDKIKVVESLSDGQLTDMSGGLKNPLQNLSPQTQTILKYAAKAGCVIALIAGTWYISNKKGYQKGLAEGIKKVMMKDMERDLEKDNVKELILGVISVMVPGTMRGKKKPIPYIPTPLMVNGTFQVMVPISIHIYEIKFNKHRFNYLKLARCF